MSSSPNNSSSELYESMSQSILNSAVDLGTDYAEIAIDQILKDGLLRDLPIVKSFVQTGKVVVAVRDLFCLKKTIRFIIEMNNGSLCSEKLEKHRVSLERNPDKLKREMESVLIFLDRQNEALKAPVLARFYKQYIDENTSFSWRDFGVFGEILESFSIYDLDTLQLLYQREMLGADQEINTLSLSRLFALGLIDYYGGISTRVNGIPNVIAKISDVGRYFYQFGFGTPD